MEINKDEIIAKRNEIKSCPVCSGNIEDRKVAIYSELLTALYQVYVWCGKNGRHEFSMKDIRELLGRNEYARFGDLVRFGGLVYKPDGKASYGLNMGRTKEFFNGQRSIPIQIVLNQITDEIVAATYVYVWQIRGLPELLDAEGGYDYKRMIPADPDTDTQEKRKLPTVVDYDHQNTLFL